MSDVYGYILTDGQFLTAEQVAKIQKAEESKQLPEADSFREQYAEAGLVQPPYNLDYLANLLEVNTTHMRCCRQKAVDAAGLGWTLIHESEGADDEERGRIEDLLRKPGDMTFRGLMEALIIDYEALGNCCMEVTRDDIGDVSGIYHVPAKTVRVHTSQKKFCQKRDVRTQWFRLFGYEEEGPLDGSSGEFGADDPSRYATEMIYIRKYHTRSDYYGLPDIIPALGALVGDLHRRDYNMQFFENNAIPQYAVVVTGCTMNDQLREMIRTYFSREVKGSAHKTLVLTVEGTEARVTFEKLAVDTRDASFREFRQDNIEEVLEAHGVPPYRVGIAKEGSLGGNTAYESTKIYKASVVEPLQEIFEGLINEQIIRQGLGIKGWSFKFADLDVEDRNAAVERDQKLFAMGALTPNQLRERHGLGEPYLGGDRYYIQSSEGAVGSEGVPEQKRARVVPLGGLQTRRRGDAIRTLGDEPLPRR